MLLLALHIIGSAAVLLLGWVAFQGPHDERGATLLGIGAIVFALLAIWWP